MIYPDTVSKHNEPELFNLFFSKCSFSGQYKDWGIPEIEISGHKYSFSNTVIVGSEITSDCWDEGHWIKKEQYKIERDSWQTPPWLFAYLNREFNFSLDAAASKENALCDKFFTVKDNALEQDWSKALKDCISKTVFCNPPYSRGSKEKFIAKAVEEMAKGVTTVMLLPALPSECWFPWDSASKITFITSGRVNFIHPLTKEEIKGCLAGTCAVAFYANGNDTIEPIEIIHTSRRKMRDFGEYVLTVDFEDHPILSVKVA